MPKKAYTPAQVVKKLGQIERQIAGGKAASAACKRAGVTEQVYRRWRKQYGGVAKRLKELEQALQSRDLDLTESLEQQTATSKILQVISGSPTDTQPVFDAIVRNCGTLFAGSRVGLWLISDGQLHGRASTGEHAREPMPIDRGSAIGVCVLDGHMVHLPDLEKAAEQYPRVRQLALKFGYHSGIFAPLLREGRAIGGISVLRREAGSFDDKEVSLLKTFADQAVIAIENVRLFNETREALDQQTATAEILKVISSSPTDVQPVFDAIVKTGVHLFGGLNLTLRLVKGDRVELVASTLPRDADIDVPFPLNDDQFVSSRTILRREVVQVADIAAEEWVSEQFKRRAERRGFRATVSAPLMRENDAIGAIVVTRAAPGLFTDKQIALLKTFAAQAVIAIENVRLFNETKEALERQTATSDILRIISGSLTDTQPVFDAIVRNCGSLFEESRVVLWLISEDRMIRARASTGEAAAEMPIDRGSAIGVCVLDGHTVHLPDLEKAAEQFPRVRQLALKFGYHSGIYAPLLREGRAIGGISVVRREAGSFDDKEVELLKTFADQAVIAIENVRLFNEIQDKSRQLQVASQHKSEFLANMSHELRTPLNAVIGFSEVLQQRMFGELTDKQSEYIDDIHSSGAHLLSLINDILDLSKVEAGRMELDVTTFSVPMAIDNALTLVKERAGRHGIALECAVDPALDEINADERKFKQILLNLLSNAVKFTPEGGRITVAANPVAGGVEVSVSDSGIGIVPEDCEAVFEEFRQVGQSDKKAEGTGLGLALARKFVEMHDGRIGVTSEVGKGSKFTFSLLNRPPSGA